MLRFLRTTLGLSIKNLHQGFGVNIHVLSDRGRSIEGGSLLCSFPNHVDHYVSDCYDLPLVEDCPPSQREIHG